MIQSQRVAHPSKGIDLTPMLDVVFIMLIFFIVTATFVQEAGIDLPAGDDSIDPIPGAEAIIVDLTAANRVFIAGREVVRPAVGAHLQRLHAQNPEQSLVLRPHAESDADTLVYVIDQARQAGIYGLKISGDAG